MKNTLGWREQPAHRQVSFPSALNWTVALMLVCPEPENEKVCGPPPRVEEVEVCRRRRAALLDCVGVA
jgi:hypothetical protein